MNVGDSVSYDLRRSHGGEVGYGVVIGIMAYSPDDAVICVADEHAYGMPINAAHCTKTGGNMKAALEYRQRYLINYGDVFKPLTLSKGGNS